MEDDAIFDLGTMGLLPCSHPRPGYSAAAAAERCRVGREVMGSARPAHSRLHQNKTRVLYGCESFCRKPHTNAFQKDDLGGQNRDAAWIGLRALGGGGFEAPGR